MGIKKIAKLANVSIGTVDRVLHNRPGVSEETQQRVQKIIDEIGYTKNTTASRLKLASLRKIKFAVLTPEAKNKWSYWKLPRKGISKAVQELKELGVKVDHFEFIDAPSFSEQSTQIFLGEYDAIVTVPFFKKEAKALLEKATSNDIPVVFVDTEMELASSANFIRQNSYNAGMVAARLLHGLIGDDGQYFVVNMLNVRGTPANTKQREHGFREFFKTNGTRASIQTINYSLNDKFKVTDEMRNWFGKDSPKGIFVTNSKSHLVSKILEKYKVKNTFIVGFDLNKQNLRYLKEDKINFLINQQPQFQGYAAIKGLFNFLTKQDVSELNHDIPVEIIVKENADRADRFSG